MLKRYKSDKYKKCSKCGNVREKTEFYRESRSEDKIASHCKKCNDAYSNAYSKKKTALVRNIKEDLGLPADLKVKESSDLKQIKQRGYQREYIRRNREANRKAQREYYDINKEKHAEWSRNWRNRRSEILLAAERRASEYDRFRYGDDEDTLTGRFSWNL